MKKILPILVLILITVTVLCSCIPAKENTITDENEIEQISNDAHLESIINLYQDNDESLIATSMQIATNLGLLQESKSGVYVEYVPSKVIHQIISELTGASVTEPFDIKDSYYAYDDINDYYYIVPLDSTKLQLNKINSISKKGNEYTINCLVYRESNEDLVLNKYEHEIIITLTSMPDNDYIKYKVTEIKHLEEKLVETYSLLETKTYGKSTLGDNLIAIYFSPKEYTKTVLLNFTIHGFEDNYDRDGQVLVDTANEIIAHYSANIDSLNKTRLIIIPLANPDGLNSGTTNNGFGRCNSEGIDLNRDFDAEHKVLTSVRNKTLEPFSAVESRALRDLVLQEKPDVVIDFHGWLNMTIGDESLAKIFKSNLNLNNKTAFNSNCNGYFSYWAHLQGAESLLVEFKNENIDIPKLINAIDEIII